ncbi:CTP synthase ura7, partial [Ascosphaera pollenicola]
MAEISEKHAEEGTAVAEHEGAAVLTSTTERKLMMKVDAHILPPLVVLYLLAFLDRVNISNAAVFNLQKDLHIEDGTKYNTALTIFFVPYIIAEIPSNILLKKFNPNVWLSGCMFFFGLVTLCQGFYLMGSWYSRAEAQKRFSFFFCSTTLAGAFGGLIASGIGNLQGDRGYNGWRWVFIIEGSCTAFIGLLWYFVIPGFPEKAKWLTEEERLFLQGKLQKDIGKTGLEDSITWRDVLDVMKDYNIWLGSLAYFGLIVPAYGYAYFAPTIIKGYGYSAVQTQLHSIPPWAAALGFAMVLAYISDRIGHRYIFAIISICVCVAGFAILLTVHGAEHRKAEYAALFLVTMGAYSAMPAIVCWFVTNLSGHKRKSIGSAIHIGFGN